MNLNDSFQKLKETDHSSSFEQVEGWLGSNKKTNTKFPIYKVAASFILLCFITIACSVPVSHDEEIGYMIKGLTPALEIPTGTSSKVYFQQQFTKADIDMRQVSMNRVLHEEIGQESVEILEVVMALPEANRTLAEKKMASLRKVFDFESVEILPIEETVERTLFESALKTFDIQVKKGMDNAQVAARINTFLHENSAFGGEAEIKVDEKGNRYVEIEVVDGVNNGTFEVQVQSKQALEQLYREVGPENNVFIGEDMTEEELIELKQQEDIKMRELKDHGNN